MTEFFGELFAILRTDQWVLEVFFTVLVTLCGAWFARRMLDKLEVRFAKTHNIYDDALLYAARGPLVWLVLLVGLSYAAEIADYRSDVGIFELIEPARMLGVIVLVALFAIRGIRFFEEHVVSSDYGETPVDVTTARAVGRLARVSVLITAVLTAAQTLGFSIAGLLAFGGVGGIAVGFAARDMLANFFGGLMIYLDRPFSVGDWIRSPDQNIEGTVEDIGWRQTRIRTFDQRPLYVPNATFTTISVENPSRMLNRRIYETIGVRYDDVAVLAPIIADVEQMLQHHEAIDTDRTLMVNFNAFGPSSLDFFVYTFTRTIVWTEYHAIKQDVLLKIADIIADHGAEVAFPTQTLHLAGGEPGSLPPGPDAAQESSA